MTRLHAPAAAAASWLLLALLCALVAAPAAAQQPDTAAVRADTAAADTAAADTAAADTARAELPPSPAVDSILEVLRGLPGYVVTEYRGDSAVYRADERVLRLRGQAEVEREGQRLQAADSIVFREPIDRVEAFGQPRVTGQQQELTGNVLYYDLARRRATALGARTQVSEGATWFVTGDVSIEDQPQRGTQVVYATHGRFTTCDLEIPHYHFESDQILVVRDRLLVARPARLYFGNVPVMVLPFVVQNLERGRRSGLIVPRFGVNDIIRTSGGGTESGTGREISDIGFFWAINDYLGAQLTGTWRSGAYTSLMGDVDFRWRERFLEGNFSYERFWQETGSQEQSINTRASWQPDERSTLNLQGQYTSSSQFIRDVSYDPREVTQQLSSTLSANRRFDWGSVNLGAQRRQSVADGSTSTTFPEIGISPKTLNLFPEPNPDLASWYNNATLNVPIRASRLQNVDPGRDLGARLDQLTQFAVNPSLTLGNLSVSTSATLNQQLFREIVGSDSLISPDPFVVSPDSAVISDRGSLTANLSYRQTLVGSTNISPVLQLSQEIRRDTLTGGEYLRGATRTSFGANLNTDLFGFFPGVGPFSIVRHRFSPRVGYSYSPAVQQDSLQEAVFGRAGGREANKLNLSFTQTFEAKLREAAVETETVADTAAAGVADEPPAAVPTEPRKVTILSITTSALEYDFNRAAEESSGFVTRSVSNSITSDYLRGLNLQFTHELFDAREAPSADEFGTFSPRLSQFSTSFQLGPDTPLLRWLGVGDQRDAEGGTPASQGAFPGTPPAQNPSPDGSGPFTGNPQSVGGGPWRVSLGYNFTRGARSAGLAAVPEAVQTVTANMSFPLSPNWALNWQTDYSITDAEFGTHRLNFKRDLHRWQANFDFYQTPNGNSAFAFYVELIDNRDLKFEHRERSLGIDRR